MINGGISGKDLFKVLPHPRIVAIDNKKEHLEQIQNGLFRAGLPCMGILYEEAEGLKMPDNWNSDSLRIIFLDLNLTDIENIGDNIGRTIGPIAEVLENLKLSGPYIIVFWTSFPEQVAELMKKLAERSTNIQLPVAFVTIDKQPFLTSTGGNGKTAKLKNAIAKELSKNKSFLAMLAWESEVEGAALRTFDRLHRLVEQKQAQGCSVLSTDLADLLRNLAKMAWGEEHARGNPCTAVTSGLSPLLLDSLDAITTNRKYVRIWENAITGNAADWNRKLPSHVSGARLNSHCMIDLNSTDRQSRGAWLKFTDMAVADTKLWLSCFGQTYAEMVKEFVNLERCKTDDNPAAICARVNLGLLECTAACDYTNNKAPLRRYILCALLPKDLEKYTKWSNGRTKHAAIFKLPDISYKDVEYFPYLNFRFTLQIPQKHRILNKRTVDMAFRLRSQVLTDISTNYAFHTTRPGIYSF